MSKANKTLWFLCWNLKIGTVQTKELANKTLVRLLLEYASTVWDPTTQRHIARLGSVQHRAARFLLNRHRITSSVGEMLQSLNWSSLEQWRRTSRLAMLYNIDNGLVQLKCSELEHQTISVKKHTHTFLLWSTRPIT